MNHDITSITAEVASAVWEKGAKPEFGTLAEQSGPVQFAAKERAFAYVTATLPIAERAVAQKMIDIINLGYELKHQPDEILMSLSFELSGVSL
jgi:hypothetical protein